MTYDMHSETMDQRDDSAMLSQLMEGVLGPEARDAMTEGRRAAAAWASANGDREREHTTRVFLKAPRGRAKDPIICVYVDSHAFQSDLMANRDLYLSRLANLGFAVSGIEFAVDREAAERRAERAREAREDEVAEPVAQPLPEDLAAGIETLPESLRASVSKAVMHSLAREVHN